MNRHPTLLAALLVAGCGSAELTGEGATLRECKDSEDNDANGLIDCDDPGCADTSICKETGDTGEVDLSTVIINEFMASNAATLVLKDGTSPDWIELFNPSEQPVDLAGWTITDDFEEPDKHELGAFTVLPFDYLVLYASGDPELGSEHLGFKLARDGEQLGLYDPDGVAINKLEYGEQATDQSAARIPDAGSDWKISSHPTPGESNRE